jgi:parvulin-like peptidyl-prolyl isomerase
MRYIYYILFILVVLSAVVGFQLMAKDDGDKNAALVINGRVITLDEFKSLRDAMSYQKGDSDFINSLITREILIQEAQKQGIDKEEAFRKSIRNFYEQSLTKALLDKKLASLQVTVSDDELNQCIGFMNKKFHLTIFTFESLEDAEHGIYREGEETSLYFEELPKELRDRILAGREGEITDPVKTGDKYEAVRVDRIEDCSLRERSGVDIERIKTILMEEKIEKAVDDWITGLRQKSSIKILVEKDEGDNP